MQSVPTAFLAFAAIAVVAAATGNPKDGAATEHKCDPVDPVEDQGWSVVPARETIGVVDGAPYQAGGAGSWFVDRTTTVLPFCHYYNSIGIYSMRSYSLAPVTSEERIAICRDDAKGGSIAVAPYAGPCPPQKPPAQR